MSMRWTPARFAQLLELLAEGYTCSAAAASLDTTKNAVVGILDRRGYKIGYRWEREGPPPTSFEERLGWPRVVQTGCRWIDGHPGEPGWQWCGAPCEPGSSWCAEHRARAWCRT